MPMTSPASERMSAAAAASAVMRRATSRTGMSGGQNMALWRAWLTGS